MSLPAFGGVIDSLSVVLEYERSSSNRMEVLFQLSRAHIINGDYQRASAYLDEGIILATEETDHRYLSDFYYLIGYCHDHANELKDAYVAFKLSQNHQALAESTVSYGKPDLFIGKYLMDIGEYEEARAVYQNIEAAFLEQGNYLELGRVHEHLGFLYRRLNNYQESILEFTLAASFYQKAESPALVAKCWAELGDNLRINNELQESIIYTKKAIEAFRILPDSAIKTTYAYHNLALAYLKMDQPEEAMQYLLPSYQSAQTIKLDPNERANIASTLADYWLAQNQTEAAKEVLLSVSNQLSAEPTKWELEAVYKLSALYEQEGELALALSLERKAKEGLVMRDNVLAARKEARQSADMQAAQVLLQLMQTEDDRRAANNKWWIASAIIVLVLGLITFYMYSRMAFYRKEAWRHATNWPELQKKMDALEQTLCMFD